MKTPAPNKSTHRFHHGDLRNAALLRAIEVVEAHGANKLSVRALARDVGVSDAAIHRHYAGRAALLAAVGHHGLAGLMRANLDAITGAATPRAAVLAVGKAYVRYCAAHPGWFRLWSSRSFQEGGGQKPPDGLMEVASEAEVQIKAQLALLVPADRVDDHYRMVWGLAHGLAGLVVERVFQRVETDEERIAAADAALHCAVARL